MNTYVFARNIDLDSHIVTNTHNYAFESARNSIKTFWLNTPIYPWRFNFRNKVNVNGVQQISIPLLYNHGNRLLNSSMTIWKSYPYSNYLIRWANSIDYSSLYNPDVFFCGSLSLFPLYRLIKPKKIVYNAHDLFSLYPNAPASIHKIEANVLDRADIVLTTSEVTKLTLQSKYGISPSKVLNLNHGVNLDEYYDVRKPADIQNLNSPIVLFVGTISLIDHQLFLNICRRLTSINFVLIGPYQRKELSIYEGLTNVHFLGPKRRSELSGYYMNSDVGLILYDKEFKENRRLGTNPMKRYDYSAAGLQIVSTSLNEYDFNPSPMYIADTVDGLIDSILNAIQNPKFTKNELISFAEANTWKNKFEILRECLD